MKLIKHSFYNANTGPVLIGEIATKAHEDALKACKMDVSKYIGESKEEADIKEAAKASKPAATAKKDTKKG